MDLTSGDKSSARVVERHTRDGVFTVRPAKLKYSIARLEVPDLNCLQAASRDSVGVHDFWTCLIIVILH